MLAPMIPPPQITTASSSFIPSRSEPSGALSAAFGRLVPKRFAIPFLMPALLGIPSGIKDMIEMMRPSTQAVIQMRHMFGALLILILSV